MSKISTAIMTGRGLICFLTAGYPSAEKTIEYAMSCVRGGADIIEIGVPFSDPVADGKVIQYASQRALETGMTPMKVFELVKELRSRTEVPIILMGYYNPIFRCGEERYVRMASEAGANGLIVPDLPMEESGTLRDHCHWSDLDLVQLVGPTTPSVRMTKIASRTSGFLYLVSSMGTTGAKKELGSEVFPLVKRAKAAKGDAPLAVGFGVSRPEHAVALREAGADAVITGSAIIKMIIDGKEPSDVEAYVRSLTGSC